MSVRIVSTTNEVLTSVRGIAFKEFARVLPTGTWRRYYRQRSSSGDTLSSSSSLSSVGSSDSQFWSHHSDVAPITVFSFIACSYNDQRHLLTDVTTNTSQFREGILLRAQERGVIFPWIHFIELQETSRHTESKLLQDYVLNRSCTLHQGQYREIRGIVPDVQLPNLPPHDQLSYMILGFKSLEKNFNQVMVDTWKDWSGARHIYLYLPDDLGLSRISLYHREAPDIPTIFKYVVVVECRNVVTKNQRTVLLDFAQRLRAERITGYISVYTPESVS